MGKYDITFCSKLKCFDLTLAMVFLYFLSTFRVNLLNVLRVMRCTKYPLKLLHFVKDTIYLKVIEILLQLNQPFYLVIKSLFLVYSMSEEYLPKGWVPQIRLLPHLIDHSSSEVCSYLTFVIMVELRSCRYLSFIL